jgi:hypothetical protein
MRYILIIIGIMLFSSMIYASELQISAILYDPDGPDGGKEWIEIYNPTENAINFYDYTFWSGDGSTEDDWTLEIYNRSHIIYSGEYMVIGESDVLPEPHIIKNLDLQNGPDSAKIMYGEEVIDIVGWGEHTYSEYYLIEPAEDVSSGSCLKRINNSGINYNDFIKGICVPHGKHSTHVPIIIEVLSSDLNILNITIDDDDLIQEGFQIIPYDKREINLFVEFNYSGSCNDITADITSTILFESIAINKSELNDLCILKATGTANTILSAKNHTVEINLSDSKKKWSFEEYIEVLDVIGFELDFSLINISLFEGSIYTLKGDHDMNSPANPTIRNIGNIPINISLIIQETEEVKISYSLLNIMNTSSEETIILDKGETASLDLYTSAYNASGKFKTDLIVIGAVI